MLRRTVLAGVPALGLAASASARQPTEIQFWHGLAQPLGGMLEQVATEFTASQSRYRIVPSFRGSYPETMVAAIAAFRAGQAPHIVQMFEVGTGTMMAAGRAVKPLHELLAETGVQIPFDDYLPAVRGYYSLRDGRMMSMPFNASTAVVFYNKDAFHRAGLDPDEFPRTWQALEQAARRMKAAGIECPMTMAWPAWTQIEQFSAIHDMPIATQGNGFAGLNAELRINNPLMVHHLRNLVAWQHEGLLRYGGRNEQGDALFPGGSCAIIFGSSGLRARIQREALFEWGVAMLPYYDGTGAAPINSIIGGASFWAMNRGPNAARTAEENRGIAEFFAWLARPEVVRKWHVETGFLPVRQSVFRALEAEGFYRRNPGAEIPIMQLLRGGGQMTENSMGLRLGGHLEIRAIIQEEMERAFQGQQDAEAALDNAVRRGNVVLRNFERHNRQ